MRNSVFLASVLVVAACTEQPEVDVVAQIVANALTPTALGHGQLSSTQLTSTSAASMGATADARTVLGFAVGCALSSTQSVDYTVGGVVYHAAGIMGVAPGWTTGALSATAAAWVSSCVLSRVNLTGTMVTISARGDNAGLDTTEGESGNYVIEEGAFWGNVFLNLGSLDTNACNGIDQSANDTYGDLPLRQCAQSDGSPRGQSTPCGFFYVGLCSDACSTNYAPYAGCGDPASDAVVTTFLYGLPL
jgi:hypothetical protein